MTDTQASTYTCPYCRNVSAGAGTTCPTCGGPVDVARRTSSGWTELAAIPDMTKLQLGRSTAQILGKLCPAADIRLAAGEGVFFAAHNLLWQEPAVEVTNLPLSGAWSRKRAGLPVVMLEAHGPGTISFSHDAPGEMLAIPLQPGQSVDVREHQMVVATSGIRYDWYPSGIWFSARGDGSASTQTGGAGVLKMGLDLAGIGGSGGRDERSDEEITYHYPVGEEVDRFTAGDAPGAVLIQSGGNAFLRELDEEESILVKPPALLWKDVTVAMQMHVEFPHAGMKLWKSWGNRYLWLRLFGPGRIALQSSYDRLEDPGTDFRDSCQYSQQIW